MRLLDYSTYFCALSALVLACAENPAVSSENTGVSKLQLEQTATPSLADAKWVNGFHGRGVARIGGDSRIIAQASDSRGNWYIGGAFSTVGSIPANALAKRSADGTWSGLGVSDAPSAVVRAYVSALAFDRANDKLYAAGLFAANGGGEAITIGSWDGRVWQRLPTGNLSFPDIKSLIVDPAGRLFVGGTFTSINDVAADGVAMWSGGEWHALGDGLAYGAEALAFGSDSILYASKGDTWNGSVVAWDGTGWSVLGDLTTSVYALAAAPNGTLYAGGVRRIIDAGYDDVVKWNGTSWESLGPRTNAEVRTLVFGNGALYAGGTTSGEIPTAKVEAWRNGNWSVLGSGMTNNYPVEVVNSLSAQDGKLLAVGTFALADGVGVDSMAEWNGSAWRSLVSGGKGLSSPVASLEVDNKGNVHAGGQFDHAGGVRASGVAWLEKATGSWHGVEFGDRGYHPVLTTVDPRGNIYIVGDFASVDGVAAHNVAMWDGRHWHALGSGIGDTAVFNDVVTDGDGNLYVAGNFSDAGGQLVHNVAKWDGSQWSSMGGGLNLEVHALIWDANGKALYAGGLFTNSVAMNLGSGKVAKWDGTEWNAMDTTGIATSNVVTALAVDRRGRLFAAGDFATIGGVSANHLAMWQAGSGWRALNASTSLSGVQALVTDSYDHLFAGGSFPGSIAEWNGSEWLPLGSGTDGAVNALAIDNFGVLHVGGDFTKAGGKASAYFAQYELGPARGDVDADGSITIVDALVVARIDAGLIPAGQYPQRVADVNCDGDVNIVDALMIAHRYVGLIVDFPVCGAG